MDKFRGNPIGYQYLLAMLTGVVEKRIKGLVGRLTRLIKLTDGETKDMIKYCIHCLPERSYQTTMMLLN